MSTHPATSRLLATVLSGFLLVLSAHGASFAQWFVTGTEGRGTVRIWGEGDEYDAWFETEAGLAVAYDRATGRYEYVDRDPATGALVGIGIHPGEEAAHAERLARLEPHLRDTSEAHRALVEARWREADEGMGLSRRWAQTKAATARAREVERLRAKGLYRGPRVTTPTTGNVCGLTILVDFPQLDENGEMTNTLAAATGEKTRFGRSYVLGMLNGVGWHEDGNYSSMREYYYENSLGKLVYTNNCTDWVLAPHPREHYDNRWRDCGDAGRELVDDILHVMEADPAYTTKYLPLLRAATLVPGTNTPRAVNVLFAGGPVTNGWSQGLWQNRYYLEYGTNSVTWSPDYSLGLSWKTRHVGTYCISPLVRGTNGTPVVGTMFHENGHMVCGFPDYYSGTGGGGPGEWTLMGSGEHVGGGCSPSGIDAYSRIQVGWADATDITADQGWLSVTNSFDCIYRFRNPTNSGEYFLIENRQKTGCNGGLPAGGIHIWRCREDGDSNQDADMWEWWSYTDLTTPARGARYRYSGELYLEQADGRYDLERKANRGNEGDLWYQGNTGEAIKGISGTGFTGVWHDDTASCSRWYDTTPSGIVLSRFSPTGQVMRVYVGKVKPKQTVTFNANGGTASFSSNVYVCGELYTNLPTATRTGHAFLGWFRNKVSWDYITTNSAVTTNATRTVYARWATETYRVKLDPNGGEGQLTTVEVAYGAPMPDVEVPVRAGYAFTGYYREKDGEWTQYYTAAGTSARNWDQATNATLWARWGPHPPNDPYAGAADLGSSPSGIVFGTNYFASAEAGEPLARRTSDGQPASVWWKWEPPYDGVVRFDTEGSTDAEGKELDTMLSVTAAYSPSGSPADAREIAFNDDRSEGSTIAALTFDTGGDLTQRGIAVAGAGDAGGARGRIRLAWDYREIRVTLDPAGGYATTNLILVPYGTAIGADGLSRLPAIHRPGWSFGGWFDSVGRRITASSIVTYNATWTARWTELLPALPAAATPDDVRAAIQGAEMVDPRVAAIVGGDLGRYNDFLEWAMGVEGYKEAAVQMPTAATSWLLGQTITFGYEPVVDILLTGYEPGSGTNPPSLRVELRATDAWGYPVWADYSRLAWVFDGAATPANWKARIPVTATPLFSSPSYATNAPFRVTPESPVSALFLRLATP